MSGYARLNVRALLTKILAIDLPELRQAMGCDVYASDLNPIACMLTWGGFNIIGASTERRAEIERTQKEVATAVDAEITRLGIEHDKHGNRAKT